MTTMNATQATGAITIVDNSAIVDGVDTLTVGGATYTFVSGTAGPTEIRIEATGPLTAANIAIRISTDVLSTFCTAAAMLDGVALTAATAGTTGNSIPLSSTASTGALTVTSFAGGQDSTDTSYATLAQLKQRVGLSVGETTNDTWLQQLLNAAAVLVDEKTRGYRPGYEAFAASASETRLFDDYIFNGYLGIDDVQTITEVKRDTTVIDSTFYRLWPFNPDNGPYERLYFSNVYAGRGDYSYYAWLPMRRATIEVTGIWGYCTTGNLPACVTEAVLRQAELWYESAQLSPTELGAMLVNPYTSLRADIEIILRPVKRSARLA